MVCFTFRSHQKRHPLPGCQRGYSLGSLGLITAISYQCAPDPRCPFMVIWVNGVNESNGPLRLLAITCSGSHWQAISPRLKSRRSDNGFPLHRNHRQISHCLLFQTLYLILIIVIDYHQNINLLTLKRTRHFTKYLLCDGSVSYCHRLTTATPSLSLVSCLPLQASFIIWRTIGARLRSTLSTLYQILHNDDGNDALRWGLRIKNINSYYFYF